MSPLLWLHNKLHLLFGISLVLEHYMVAWRYEISLLVVKNYFTHSLRSLVKYFSTLEEKIPREISSIYVVFKKITTLSTLGTWTDWLII